MDVRWIMIPSFFLACVATGCSTACSKTDECGKDQCCVILSTNSRRGICRKLSRETESCSMPGDVFKKYGEKYVIACPCGDDLVCTSKAATKEIVYGPMAVMQLKCKKKSKLSGKPVEKPVQGDDGVEIIYEEMDGGKISEDEIFTKEIKRVEKAILE